MNRNGKAPWVTRTAAITALLVVLQAVTAPLGNTLLTGSLVNMLLIVSVMTCGLLTGISVAVVSPAVAKLIGIGPLWSLIPFIIAGNAVLVLCWHLIGNGKRPCLAAAAAVVENGLNVRQTEALCKKLARPEPQKKPEPQRPALPGEVEIALRETLGNEVRVDYKNGRGSLTVHFYSDAQLTAFANLLGGYQKETTN